MADTDDADLIEPVWLGATRPAMIWGVPYVPWILNVGLVTIGYIHTQNLFVVVMMALIHIALALICREDPNALGAFWRGITRCPWRVQWSKPLRLNRYEP